MIQYPRDKRAVNLHGARRTEFLTTKAGNAGAFVNDGQSVLHDNGLGGADLCALFASNAIFFYRSGLCAQGRAYKGGGEFSGTFKL